MRCPICAVPMDSVQRKDGLVTHTCRSRSCAYESVTVDPGHVEHCPRCEAVMHEWRNFRTGASVLVCQGVRGYGCGQPPLYRIPDEVDQLFRLDAIADQGGQGSGQVDTVSENERS